MLVWIVASLFLCLFPSASARARPLELSGRWYVAPAEQSLATAPAAIFEHLQVVAEPGRTGGRYWYRGEFDVERAGRYVVDFRNSTTIGKFRHLVFDASGERVAEVAGGIESRTSNPFLLRHGRELTLTPGRYRVVSELDSPFLLASPEPFLATIETYREAIKLGNVVALVGLGVLLGLGFYYAALAIARRRVADSMYALFILGNLLYNGAALLVFSDVLGIPWFYLISVPILVSNMAYVLFVVALLEVQRASHPWLYRGAVGLLALFALFGVLAIVRPSWSLELDRIGVGLFTTYGLITAIVRSRAGYTSARWYLVAISAFFLLGGLSISLSRFDAEALCVEHLGLIAVVVEAALLALVLAHQFSLLHEQKDSAEHRAKEGYRIAYRDALTGLPNRYSLESDLARLPSQGSLTFIDLDGLKHYNDRYGHQRGDELLCGFAEQLSVHLGERAALYRLSGDEFAVTSPTGDLEFVERRLDEAIDALRKSRFRFAGASFGSVRVSEDPSRNSLKHIADTRMYEQKRQRRASAPAEWLRTPIEEEHGEPSAIRRASGGSDDPGRA